MIPVSQPHNPSTLAVFSALLVLVLGLGLGACGGASGGDHGTLSRLSTVEGDVVLCEHEVPADVCTRCNPELEGQYREIGDWCGPHRVPESQCHRCHPDLTFAPLPELEVEADYAELSDEQALEGVENHVVPGKITVVDFYAPWCAPCLNLEIRLHELANTSPDVAVRKVTVMRWQGPVVDRYMSDVDGLPFVMIYDADGDLVAELDGDRTDRLEAVIEELRAQ